MDDNLQTEKIDLKKSIFKIETNEKDTAMWKQRVLDWRRNLLKDQSDRKRIYQLRRDFFEGNQAKYSNIVGITKKEKKGHANAVYNLAGKMLIKIYYALGNNPPHYIIRPLLKIDKVEQIKAQAVEDFIGRVFWMNRFWLMAYKRGVMNQTLMANYAIMVYPDFVKNMIRIINYEKMENLMVGWRGDDTTEYDYTIYEENRSVYSIEQEFGIKVQPMNTSATKDEATASGHEDPYEMQSGSRGGTQKAATQPSGKTDVPMARYTDVWTDTHNIILINNQVVQLVEHEFGFNPVILGRNIHNPGKPWDISDMDYLMDAQVELNEAQNDVRDFIRTGVNQKYRAHNMPDFDPESLKTGSGQVIYTQDDETFDPIPVNVNTFPADNYLLRVEKMMHKLGIPEVTFGSGATAGVSGKARAIDFSSFADTIVDKQQSWEYVLEEVSERIQILGNKFFAPKDKNRNFFLGPDGQFEVREINFKWDDVLPVAQSERIVDILNKKSAKLISLQTALEEGGYNDPEAEMERIKEEFKDPELAPIIANQLEVLTGIVQATVKAQMTQMQEMQEGGMGGEQSGSAPAENPTLTPDQNGSGMPQPMAQVGTTRRFASPAGAVANATQNTEAAR